MRDKTRNLIRRSQEKSLVTEPDDPEEFLRFYAANCESRRQINRYHTPMARKLLELCLQRGQGRIFLSRARGNGAVNAAIFVVWDAESMYFLMSSRTPDSADSGAISHLVWLAMNEAHRRGVKFDFDGVSSPAPSAS